VCAHVVCVCVVCSLIASLFICIGLAVGFLMFQIVIACRSGTGLSLYVCECENVCVFA
jgi:hypothetical protein